MSATRRSVSSLRVSSRLAAYFPTPGYCDEEMNFYQATGLREPGPDEKAEPDEDEDIEKRSFALDEIRAMIRAGRNHRSEDRGGFRCSSSARV